MFVPKSVVCLREGYTRDAVLRDVTAGVVVAVVALPLALAFAIASGVPPERGLYTAIVAGFLISALGGSRVQIGGPTGAFVVIVYGIVSKHGYDGLVVCTLLAGIILIILGLTRMGALIKFIPYPVVTGFTAGIAVIIFSSQVKDFLGLRMGAVPPDFLEKWNAYSQAFGTLQWPTVAIAAGSLLVLMLWPKAWRLVPAPFVAMALATLAVQFLDLPVETIGSRFGGIPSSLPRPHWPAIPWAEMRELVSPSLTIALLAAIESLLSAVVADGMIGTRHKANMELVAQGVANLASPIFGGIPATGAIARTATNIRTGGRTPLAGITHAVTLLAVLAFAGEWAAKVPLAALAAILVMVAFHMSEWRSFAGLLRAPRSDVAVLLITFVLTVFVDLTVAVQVGVVVASLLFIRRMSEVTNIEAMTAEMRGRESRGGSERDHAGPQAAPNAGEPGDSGRCRDLRGGRALLLRRGGQAQGRHAGDLQTSESARPAHAERTCHRCHRHSRARADGEEVPRAGHAHDPVRGSHPAITRPRPRSQARDPGRAGQSRSNAGRGHRARGQRLIAQIAKTRGGGDQRTGSG